MRGIEAEDPGSAFLPSVEQRVSSTIFRKRVRNTRKIMSGEVDKYLQQLSVGAIYHRHCQG